MTGSTTLKKLKDRKVKKAVSKTHLDAQFAELINHPDKLKALPDDLRLQALTWALRNGRST